MVRLDDVLVTLDLLHYAADLAELLVGKCFFQLQQGLLNVYIEPSVTIEEGVDDYLLFLLDFLWLSGHVHLDDWHFDLHNLKNI